MKPLDVVEYIGRLPITQGEGIGQPMRLYPWERRFIRGALAPDVEESALSVGRGCGKTVLVSALACAALDGPLSARRGETVIVASSFDQARISFEHIRGFLAERIEADPNTLAAFRTAPEIERPASKTGTPARAFGYLVPTQDEPTVSRPILVLCRRAQSQWPPASSDKMIAALRTSLGKIAGARLIAAWEHGPRAMDHWFEKMLPGRRGLCSGARGPRY